jgi:hypothetical protein
MVLQKSSIMLTDILSLFLTNLMEDIVILNTGMITGLNGLARIVQAIKKG